ncbi:MAG: dodecin family protein [Candidatus Hydrogenedentales bacterium]|jgi:hypothetical protein
MAAARVAEINASSTTSFSEAVKEALVRAHDTLENVKSAWVKDQKVLIDEKDDVSEYRVLLKITSVHRD